MLTHSPFTCHYRVPIPRHAPAHTTHRDRVLDRVHVALVELNIADAVYK